jgi:SpoIID/LytB domain protein
VARLGQHREGCDCGLWSSTADQVYGGWDKEVASYGARWRAAVQRTRGLVATFGGRLIQAYYHSSSGGHTESNAYVWGGSQIPYLRGVCDPGDYTIANPNRAWRTTLDGATIGDRLGRATGHRIGAARRFVGTTRTAAGRVLATTAVGTDGRVRVSGDTLASALGLRDTKVWIGVNRNVRGAFRDRYDTLECRPGLPTSRPMGVPGGGLQRFQHGTLYYNSMRQRTLWLHGVVQTGYMARHESRSALGMPRTDVRRIRAPGCANVRCVRALFEHGGIYARPGPGLHSVVGGVFRAYRHHGGTGGLGFPTSDVRRARDGSRYAMFQRGTIRCRHGHCRVRLRG